jgi:hypothetical protein
VVFHAVNLAEGMHSAEVAGAYTIELVAAAPPPPGRFLRVCGSCASLGSWVPTGAPEMVLRPSGMLSLRARLPAADIVEFKLLEAGPGGSDIKWQVCAAERCWPGAACSNKAEQDIHSATPSFQHSTGTLHTVRMRADAARALTTAVFYNASVSAADVQLRALQICLLAVNHARHA